MTIGSRLGAAANSISYMRASPCEDVAVNVRTPPAEAPMATDMTECSDSAGMNSASISPSLMNSEICSMIVV